MPTRMPLPRSSRRWTTLPTPPMVRGETLTQPCKRHVACSLIVPVVHRPAMQASIPLWHAFHVVVKH